MDKRTTMLRRLYQRQSRCQQQKQQARTRLTRWDDAKDFSKPGDCIKASGQLKATYEGAPYMDDFHYSFLPVAHNKIIHSAFSDRVHAVSLLRSVSPLQLCHQSKRLLSKSTNNRPQGMESTVCCYRGRRLSWS